MSKRMGANSKDTGKLKICKYSMDHISQLPDDILVSVLSRLSLEQAARTSTLSHRWRFLWTLVPRLNLDAISTFDEVECNRESVVSERLRYIKWVNAVTRSYRGPSIEAFRVRFDLDQSSAHNIDCWVGFAIGKGVKELELNLYTYENLPQSKPYRFLPLCTSFKQLRSRPLGFSNCHSLTSLRLKSVNISGKILEYFLSNCLSLEHLSVTHSDSLLNLEVPSPSLKLKYLKLWHCKSMKSLRISANSIVSLKFTGNPGIKVSLKNAPMLDELKLWGRSGKDVFYCSHQLSSCLPRLKKLTICIDSALDARRLEFPLFNNLNELVLQIDSNHRGSILDCTSLVSAAPHLSKLTLKLQRSELVVREPINIPKRPHLCLKVVEFTGWIGKAVDVELAKYFLENAVKLEKVIFNNRELDIIGAQQEIEEITKAARERVMGLQREVQLVVAIMIV